MSTYFSKQSTVPVLYSTVDTSNMFFVLNCAEDFDSGRSSFVDSQARLSRLSFRIRVPLCIF